MANLLDADAGRRRGGVEVTNERLVLEHADEAVLRPQRFGQPATLWVDEEKFDFVADGRRDAGFLQRRLDPAQRAPGTHRDRCAVLFEK